MTVSISRLACKVNRLLKLLLEICRNFRIGVYLVALRGNGAYAHAILLDKSFQLACRLFARLCTAECAYCPETAAAEFDHLNTKSTQILERFFERHAVKGTVRTLRVSCNSSFRKVLTTSRVTKYSIYVHPNRSKYIIAQRTIIFKQCAAYNCLNRKNDERSTVWRGQMRSMDLLEKGRFLQC